MILGYNDFLVRSYTNLDSEVNCRNITFQVTDDCCLKCSYCYQINKHHHMMSKEVARKGIDLLFKLYDENKEGAYINHHTHGIILDLIGGEPFMNVEVMDFIVDYFIQQCVERKHEWLTNFRISISSNGILYFNENVQNFIKKYENLISLNITVDGPKEIHDSCRVDYDGNGSFERAIAAADDWYARGHEDITTKITIAPENLGQLNTIFDFFIKRGYKYIFANPIYEQKWTSEQGKEYYKQLIILADRLLKEKEVYSTLFEERNFGPLLSSENNNWCGGVGAMLAFDYNGLAFPCLRYMESSLGSDKEPIIVGSVDGIYNTPETQKLYTDLCAVTRRSQSTDECWNCQIASGCAWCSAWNYQSLGSFNKRSTNICWMHRARALANVYYWNNRYIKEKKEKIFPLYLSRDIATSLISDEEYDDLIRLTVR